MITLKFNLGYGNFFVLSSVYFGVVDNDQKKENKENKENTAMEGLCLNVDIWCSFRSQTSVEIGMIYVRLRVHRDLQSHTISHRLKLVSWRIQHLRSLLIGCSRQKSQPRGISNVGERLYCTLTRMIWWYANPGALDIILFCLFLYKKRENQKLSLATPL